MKFFNSIQGSGSVTINGKTYKGRNVLVVNGRVIIDGKDASDQPDGTAKTYNIHIEGSLNELKIEGYGADVTVQGDVNGDLLCDGSAAVSGAVGAKVSAGGSVKCGDVHGSVNAGGSVKCGTIGGRVNAGGSISRR